MNARLAAVLTLFVAFTAYSMTVAAGHGYTGFIDIALADAWAGQMLIDLVIALGLFVTWMVRDAREHAIPAWPYVIATLTLGSVGALAYLVHRETRRLRAPRQAVNESRGTRQPQN